VVDDELQTETDRRFEVVLDLPPHAALAEVGLELERVTYGLWSAGAGVFVRAVPDQRSGGRVVAAVWASDDRWAALVGGADPPAGDEDADRDVRAAGAPWPPPTVLTDVVGDDGEITLGSFTAAMRRLEADVLTSATYRGVPPRFVLREAASTGPYTAYFASPEPDDAERPVGIEVRPAADFDET